MSQFGLSGLASGVSTDSIIEKILQAESVRITRAQMKKSTVQAKQNAWQQVKDALVNVRSKVDALRLAGTFSAREATLSDATVATVKMGASAALGTHTLAVTQLAQTHVVVGANQTSPNTALAVAGFLTINGQQVEVTAEDTLASLRDKINGDAGSVVTAEVQKVMNGADTFHRLILTSEVGGAAGELVLTDDQGGVLMDSLGFTTGGVINELVSAQDSAFVFNNVAYGTASNEVTDILPGLSFTLTKAGTPGSPLTTSIAISQDTDRVADAAENWVKALNQVDGLLKNLTVYDAKTGQRGLLQGDSQARGLQNSLRSMTSNIVTGLPGDLDRLSQVGIKTGGWGTPEYGLLTVDRAVLTEQLVADETSVARLFGAIPINAAAASAGATIDAALTSATAAGTYAAEDVINGDSDPARFGTVGGGWESATTPSVEAQVLAVQFSGLQTVDRLRLYLPDSDGTQGIKDFTVEYRDSGGTWQTLSEITDHSGSARTVTFDPVTTDAVRLVVTATHNDSPVRVTELEIQKVSNGMAARMNRYLNDALAIQTGPIAVRNDGFGQQIKSINQQVERMTDRLTQRETRLRKQFARMESALAQMQSQGNQLSMQMASLTQSQTNR